MAGMSQEINSIQPIAADIKKLIEKSRQNVALAVNAEITLLYCHIGKRIKTEILGNERSEYVGSMGPLLHILIYRIQSII